MEIIIDENGNIEGFTKSVDQLPEINLEVLLVYTHKRKGGYGGKSGTFVTQGVLKKQGRNYFEWDDYLDRALQSLQAKSSNNNVTHWKYLTITKR